MSFTKKTIKPNPLSDGNELPDAKFLGDAEDLKIKDEDDESIPFIDELAIMPIGYPMRSSDTVQTNGIIIDDMDLFQKYCVEQWNSSIVSVGTYLFDQYLFPDFAFQVIGVKPGAGRIHLKTKIIYKNGVKDKLLSKIPPIGLDDVIGQEEAKRKVKIILKYLENPEAFGKEWAPRNILFHGPPGTGKTMLAQALAHEAEASFMTRSGTKLIGQHVGDGAKRIHDLYAEATSAGSPVVIFIDELDAIGLSRSFQHVRGDVIEVSTALLSELDGLMEKMNVVTIGATNQIDLLDSALRSRFEEEILFNLPDLNERIELLRVYSKKIPLEVKMDFKRIALKLEKWSGRDIKEKLLKNLVHDSILNKDKFITTDAALALISRLKGKKDTSFHSLSI